MTKSYSLILTALLLFRCTFQELLHEQECEDSSGKSERTIKISLSSRRNQTGEWVDSFIARAEASNSSSDLNWDLTHRVTECDGLRFIYVTGATKDTSLEGNNEHKLKFHPRCGKNAALSNGGLTVDKINYEDALNSVALTNRPLRNNEIFEVRLDKKNTKFSYSLGIGITTVSPVDGDILPQMYASPNAWIYHHGNIYSKNTEFLKYNAKNINELQVGDRVGVMRNDLGVLHFFVNGADQGPAMSNVPKTVYGVFELWYNAVKATIVHSNKPSLS